jgi:hypothetical protein
MKLTRTVFLAVMIFVAGAVIPAIAHAQADDPQSDLILSGHSPAPAPLYAGYIDIRTASVAKLGDGSYVFTMTFYGTIPETPFDPANGKPVAILRYVWRLFDSSGAVVLRVRLSWMPGGWWAQYGNPGSWIITQHYSVGTDTVTVTIPASSASYWDAHAWIDNKPGLWGPCSDSAQALGEPAFLEDGYEGGSLP